MLTTLLLKHYPDRNLTFVPEAVCWTIVPHTMRILLSQRRRWINSTMHNMFELLKVNLRGVCCLSMKVVVFIDLIATMILPASYVYFLYLFFLVFFGNLPVSTVLLILYGIIMGVQVVVFILRSRWDYLWWFFIYFTVGLPVFYLILPVYCKSNLLKSILFCPLLYQLLNSLSARPFKHFGIWMTSPGARPVPWAAVLLLMRVHMMRRKKNMTTRRKKNMMTRRIY